MDIMDNEISQKNVLLFERTSACKKNILVALPVSGETRSSSLPAPVLLVPNLKNLYQSPNRSLTKEGRNEKAFSTVRQGEDIQVLQPQMEDVKTLLYRKLLSKRSTDIPVDDIGQADAVNKCDEVNCVYVTQSLKDALCTENKTAKLSGAVKLATPYTVKSCARPVTTVTKNRLPPSFVHQNPGNLWIQRRHHWMGNPSSGVSFVSTNFSVQASSCSVALQVTATTAVDTKVSESVGTKPSVVPIVLQAKVNMQISETNTETKHAVSSSVSQNNVKSNSFVEPVAQEVPLENIRNKVKVTLVPTSDGPLLPKYKLLSGTPIVMLTSASSPDFTTSNAEKSDENCITCSCALVDSNQSMMTVAGTVPGVSDMLMQTCHRPVLNPKLLVNDPLKSKPADFVMVCPKGVATSPLQKSRQPKLTDKQGKSTKPIVKCPNTSTAPTSVALSRIPISNSCFSAPDNLQAASKTVFQKPTTSPVPSRITGTNIQTSTGAYYIMTHQDKKYLIPVTLVPTPKTSGSGNSQSGTKPATEMKCLPDNMLKVPSLVQPNLSTSHPSVSTAQVKLITVQSKAIEKVDGQLIHVNKLEKNVHYPTVCIAQSKTVALQVTQPSEIPSREKKSPQTSICHFSSSPGLSAVKRTQSDLPTSQIFPSASQSQCSSGQSKVFMSSSTQASSGGSFFKRFEAVNTGRKSLGDSDKRPIDLKQPLFNDDSDISIITMIRDKKKSKTESNIKLDMLKKIQKCKSCYIVLQPCYVKSRSVTVRTRKAKCVNCKELCRSKFLHRYVKKHGDLKRPIEIWREIHDKNLKGNEKETNYSGYINSSGNKIILSDKSSATRLSLATTFRCSDSAVVSYAVAKTEDHTKTVNVCETSGIILGKKRTPKKVYSPTLIQTRTTDSNKTKFTSQQIVCSQTGTIPQQSTNTVCIPGDMQRPVAQGKITSTQQATDNQTLANACQSTIAGQSTSVNAPSDVEAQASSVLSHASVHLLDNNSKSQVCNSITSACSAKGFPQKPPIAKLWPMKKMSNTDLHNRPVEPRVLKLLVHQEKSQPSVKGRKHSKLVPATTCVAAKSLSSAGPKRSQVAVILPANQFAFNPSRSGVNVASNTNRLPSNVPPNISSSSGKNSTLTAGNVTPSVLVSSGSSCNVISTLTSVVGTLTSSTTSRNVQGVMHLVPVTSNFTEIYETYSHRSLPASFKSNILLVNSAHKKLFQAVFPSLGPTTVPAEELQSGHTPASISLCSYKMPSTASFVGTLASTTSRNISTLSTTTCISSTVAYSVAPIETSTCFTSVHIKSEPFTEGYGDCTNTPGQTVNIKTEPTSRGYRDEPPSVSNTTTHIGEKRQAMFNDDTEVFSNKRMKYDSDADSISSSEDHSYRSRDVKIENETEVIKDELSYLLDKVKNLKQKLKDKLTELEMMKKKNSC